MAMIPASGLWKLTEADVQATFRHLSKAHHPDKGGTPESFHFLVSAKDELLGRGNLLKAIRKHCNAKLSPYATFSNS